MLAIYQLGAPAVPVTPEMTQARSDMINELIKERDIPLSAAALGSVRLFTRDDAGRLVDALFGAVQSSALAAGDALVQSATPAVTDSVVNAASGIITARVKPLVTAAIIAGLVAGALSATAIVVSYKRRKRARLQPATEAA
jgi:hypothetical protein